MSNFTYENSANLCKIPPDGWVCTREHGHDGPCAAWPTNYSSRWKHFISWLRWKFLGYKD